MLIFWVECQQPCLIGYLVLLQRYFIATEELDPANFSVVREGSGSLGLKPTDDRFSRTRYKAGPDIVRSPNCVRPGIKISIIVTNEADTIRTSIICPDALVTLVVLLSLLQEPLGCTKSFFMPITEWPLIFLDGPNIGVFTIKSTKHLDTI